MTDHETVSRVRAVQELAERVFQNRTDTLNRLTRPNSVPADTTPSGCCAAEYGAPGAEIRRCAGTSQQGQPISEDAMTGIDHELVRQSISHLYLLLPSMECLTARCRFRIVFLSQTVMFFPAYLFMRA